MHMHVPSINIFLKYNRCFIVVLLAQASHALKLAGALNIQIHSRALLEAILSRVVTPLCRHDMLYSSAALQNRLK